LALKKSLSALVVDHLTLRPLNFGNKNPELVRVDGLLINQA
jgi:hypothetical protein